MRPYISSPVSFKAILYFFENPLQTFVALVSAKMPANSLPLRVEICLVWFDFVLPSCMSGPSSHGILPLQWRLMRGSLALNGYGLCLFKDKSRDINMSSMYKKCEFYAHVSPLAAEGTKN